MALRYPRSNLTSILLGLKSANAETNAGEHRFLRALAEGGDLNAWFNAADIHERLTFRTASFCSERSGHYDAYDQGLTMFLPNMTWFQPAAHVHAMIKDTWQPNGLDSILHTGATTDQNVSAQRSDDKATVVIRYTNSASSSIQLELSLISEKIKAPCKMTVLTLQSDDMGAENTPGEPDLISPKQTIVQLVAFPSTLNISAQSYSVIVLQQQADESLYV